MSYTRTPPSHSHSHSHPPSSANRNHAHFTTDMESQQKVTTSPTEVTSIIQGVKRLETTAYAPPKDTSHWKESTIQLDESHDRNDVEIMEPNCCHPDKTYVDSEAGSDSEDGNQESVVADDERIAITPTTSSPYKWICSLRMTHANGKRYIGTGFFCTITGSSKFAVVTCAHNLYSKKKGGYARKVEIIQARDRYTSPFGSFSASSQNLRVPDEYKMSPRPDHDYGVIVFDKRPPGEDSVGFGYRVMGDRELSGRIVQTCGYPGDKPGGTLWLAGGEINRVKSNRIFYSNDTYGGQSGSPVWTWSGWNFMLIGVHGYGLRTRNSARRVNDEMIRQIQRWMREF